jgi:sugar/nucleoside kinase (ribokinase family)
MLKYYQPIDYLVIGHITQDMTEQGPILGGTASYAALTAKALGLRVGIVTSMASDVKLELLDGIQIHSETSEFSSTFENTYTPEGRIQHIYHVASNLDYSMVPDSWRDTPIIHLGPVAQEVEPNLVRSFPNSFVGLTPQGWLRTWDKKNKIHPCEWPESNFVLGNASAAVLSIEDVQGDESRIEEMASSVRILVVTEGASGCRLFWNGDLRRFSPPPKKEVDPVGAGDIFATAFFTRLHATHDPWEAARFATYLAANSVTRRGLEGVPTSQEVEQYTIEVIN